jgi:hypothetical protein
MKSVVRKWAGGAIAAAVVMGLSGPASATVATSIKITSGMPGGDWLQIGELQAFADGVNVALASSGAQVFGTGSYDLNSTPAKATDGIISTSFPDIYHSDGAGPHEYLLVKFTSAFDLSDIVIYGRGDFASERNLFTYELYNFGQYGDMLVGAGSLDARNGSYSASAQLPVAPTAAVPEPATWFLMIGGFGAMGAALRRRPSALRLVAA